MISSMLQVAGAVAITAGALLISIPVGIIIGGVFVLMIGIAVAR